MPDGTERPPEEIPSVEAPSRPTVSACPSCPHKVVFIEAGNTDGWLATDLTVPVDR